ncbi:DUF3616 domain-containing protein [Archangium violaceum]|uniref:DUF3616 domain-containing protein n=1 Tax=Archangium violaceum TaxID=83451 RepID=UPI00193C5738|nr:DUF3616 domain-containing protein [Archangium violaceum]QRK09444.1 DUF3616 domain-containing protein [Archangium violaceum]
MFKTAFLVSTLLGAAPADRAPSAATLSKVVTFEGMCDASGAVVSGGFSFTVADDEDNIIRVYDGKAGGRPVKTTDMSPSLLLPEGKKRAPETDIEAATEIPPLAFWLTSHGRKSSGKVDANRFRFFATRSRPDGTTQLEGKPYTRLLEDLLAAPQLEAFELATASTRAPKEEGGLNIEGMTAMEDGKSILIGFRSPLHRGKAITVTLLNPLELPQGKPARLGPARLLDFGGLGIRAISWWRGQYLFIGGTTSSGGTSRLFTWDGKSEKPSVVEGVDFTDLNPEAFVTFEDKEEILVLSDDGTRLMDGVECKRLKEPEKKRFRGVWLRLPQHR